MRFRILVASAALLGVASNAIATSPSFVLAPGSPTLGVIGATPADVLLPAIPPVPGPIPPPVVGIPAGALGLLPGDVVNGLSYGLLPPIFPFVKVLFSVDPLSSGAPWAPPPPNVGCEAAGGQAHGDVFLAQPIGPPLPFFNVVALDGNGVADSPCGLPPLPGLGLLEPATPDDVVGLEMCPASFVFSGVMLTAPVYVTLAPGSPTLGLLGATPGDVLVKPAGLPPPAIFMPAPALGLAPGDVVDAIDVAPGALFAAFSLAPGSPSLAGCGWSARDVLLSGPGACGAVVGFPPMGLLAGDNIDALVVNYDTDYDFLVDPCDNCVTIANNDQLDTDADGYGDACDNCPLVSNPTQFDGDGDMIGDACDLCTGGVGMTKPLLKYSKLPVPNVQKMILKGTAAFPGALPIPPLDLTNLGMRVHIVDIGAGNAIVFDHTIPAAAVPTACGVKDGWKPNTAGTVHKYVNKTNAIQPACVPGSSLGITGAKGIDKTASLKGLKFKVQGKNATYTPLAGPFAVTVIFGGASEGSGGQCAEHTFLAGECALNGSGTTLKCKTP